MKNVLTNIEEKNMIKKNFEKRSSGKKIARINIRLPEYFYNKLKELERTGIYGSMSDIVRTALAMFFEKIEREKQREKLITERALHELAEDEELLEEFAEKIKKDKELRKIFLDKLLGEE